MNTKNKVLVLVTGHASFATGILSPVELIAGTFDNVRTVNFTANDSDTSLTQNINSTIDKYFLDSEKQENKVLFFCDLLGGTPFRVAALIANTLPNARVIAGGNLGSLIQLILSSQDTDSLDTLSDECVTATTESVMVYREKPSKNTNFEASNNLDNGI